MAAAISRSCGRPVSTQLHAFRSGALPVLHAVAGARHHSTPADNDKASLNGYYDGSPHYVMPLILAKH